LYLLYTQYQALVYVLAQTDEEQSKSLFKLAISWNYIDVAQTTPKDPKSKRELYPGLFEQALKENRPVFVDYFLRRNFNPFETIQSWQKAKSQERTIQESSKNQANSEGEQQKCALDFFTEVLYRCDKRVTKFFDGWKMPEQIEKLDQNYARLIGPYADSFYFKRTRSAQLQQDARILFRLSPGNVTETASTKKLCDGQLNKQELLRELFLWSVNMGRSEIAFVLLLQIDSRMCAALVAATMAKHLSSFASTLDVRHTYSEQAKAYEAYATACIDACYKQNERRACQLLSRENPLFGNVTCMQLAISARLITFINTRCFNQVLDHQWYGGLPGNATESLLPKVKFFSSLITLGVIPHALRRHHKDDVIDQTFQKSNNSDIRPNKRDRWKGIEDFDIESPKYLEKVFYFHSAPIVKMCYHFVSHPG